MTTSNVKAIPLTGTAATILRAASAVFVRNGYANTTIADIAEEAEITRPTVYAYYDSKEDVFRQLAEQVRQEFLSLQRVDPNLPVVEIVRQADREYLRIYARHERLLTVIKHQTIGDPSMGAIWREIHHLPNRRHTRFIEAQRDSGTVNPIVSPSTIAEMTTGIATRFSELLRTEPQRFEDLLAEMVRIHLTLLGLPPSHSA